MLQASGDIVPVTVKLALAAWTPAHPNATAPAIIDFLIIPAPYPSWISLIGKILLVSFEIEFMTTYEDFAKFNKPLQNESGFFARRSATRDHD
jgi:hypothetical protein